MKFPYFIFGFESETHPRLMEICSQHPVMHIFSHQGNALGVQPLPQKAFGSNFYNGRRGEIHEILLQYAKEMGVDVRFGHDVREYWEEDGRAGVVVGGKRLEADVVVVADGLRSKARESVLVSAFWSVFREGIRN